MSDLSHKVFRAETEAVRQHLAEEERPSVDRAALRDRIAEALRGCGVYDDEERLWRSLSPAWIAEITPAVLSVLPEPADPGRRPP
ncbi:hypothetical protein ACRJ4W_07440 [Streptomyces sp. GLT-R25]